ncbi:enhanced serine sensitivity protein SseB C-terminal domain-containing protein [Streptomyces thermolineatus]|uniref:enhanced serine sensitivity protein SseB C-terminal domain-containing protein n=1 Tax=Streptomyces thermolineatus TaxID=44033 RepID=UPI00384D1971
MSAGAGGGTAASGHVEQLLHQVSPGRFDTYEQLLHALADSRVWMLLWHGSPGSPDAQYGHMEIAGHGYAPCATSEHELAASGWDRAHEVVSGRDIAASLFRSRYGLWLNPHAPGGGVGVPWADLRRIASGLDRLPAGPLRLSEPTLQIPQFYALLSQTAHRTPVVRTLRRAWVEPAYGDAYLAIGMDLYDTGPQALDAVRTMMHHCIGAAPEGLPVSTVAMADEYDPVAQWMQACQRPFFDREAFGAGPAPAMPPPPVAAPGPGRPAATGWGAPQHAPQAPGWGPPQAPPVTGHGGWAPNGPRTY